MPSTVNRCWYCCQMSFGKKNLLKHIERDHVESLSPNYCHVCRIDCSRLDVLLRHVLVHDWQSKLAASLKKPRSAASEEELLYLRSPRAGKLYETAEDLAPGQTASCIGITEEASRLVSSTEDLAPGQTASCTDTTQEASRLVSSTEDLAPGQTASCIGITEEASRVVSSTEDLAPGQTASCTDTTQEASQLVSAAGYLDSGDMANCNDSTEEASRLVPSTEDLTPGQTASCTDITQEASQLVSTAGDLDSGDIANCTDNTEEASRLVPSTEDLAPQEATQLDSGLISAPATEQFVENNGAGPCLLIISDETDSTPAAELVGNAGDVAYIITDECWPHVFDEMSISETVVPHSEIKCPPSELSEGIGGEYLTSEGSGTIFPTQGSDEVSEGIGTGVSSSSTGMKDSSRSIGNRTFRNWPFSLRKEESSSSAVRCVEEVLLIESNRCLLSTGKHSTETENFAVKNLSSVSSVQNTEQPLLHSEEDGQNTGQPLLHSKEDGLKEVKKFESVACVKTDIDSLGNNQFKEKVVDCLSRRRKQATCNTINRRLKKYGKATGLNEVLCKEVIVIIDKLPLSIVKGRTVLLSAEENNNTKWNETAVLCNSFGTAISTDNEDSVRVDKSQVLSTSKFQNTDKKNQTSRSKKAQKSTSTKVTSTDEILARSAKAVIKKKQVTWVDQKFFLPKPILPTVQDLSLGNTQEGTALLVSASSVNPVSTINRPTTLNFDNVKKCEPTKSGVLKTSDALALAPAPPANNSHLSESKCKKKGSRKARGQKPANMHSLGEKQASNCEVSSEITSEQNSVSPIKKNFQTMKVYNRNRDKILQGGHCLTPTPLKIQNKSKEENQAKEEKKISDLSNHVIDSKYIDGMTCQTEGVQSNIAGDVIDSPRLYEDCYAEEWCPDIKQGWECLLTRNDECTQPVNQESESSPMEKNVVHSMVPLPEQLPPPSALIQPAREVHTVNQCSQGTEAICEELLFQNSCSDLRILEQTQLFTSYGENSQQEIQTHELSTNPSVALGNYITKNDNPLSPSKSSLVHPEALSLAVTPSEIKNIILPQMGVESTVGSPALGFHTLKDSASDLTADPTGNPIDLETKDDQQTLVFKKVSRNPSQTKNAASRKRNKPFCSNIIDVTAVSSTISRSGKNTVVSLQQYIRDAPNMAKMSEAIEENTDEADNREKADIYDNFKEENVLPVYKLATHDDDLPVINDFIKTRNRGKAMKMCSWSLTKQTRSKKSEFCVAEQTQEPLKSNQQNKKKMSNATNNLCNKTGSGTNLQGQALNTLSRETRSKNKAKLCVAVQTREPFKANFQEECNATNVHSNELHSGVNADLLKEGGSSEDQAKLILAENIQSIVLSTDLSYESQNLQTGVNNSLVSESFSEITVPLPPSSKKHRTDCNRKAKKKCVWAYPKRRRSMKSKLKATPVCMLHCDSSIVEQSSKKANNEEQHSVSEFCDAVQSEEKLLAVFDPAIDTTVRQGKRKAKVCCVDEKPIKLLELNEQGDDLIRNSKAVHGVELNSKSFGQTSDLVKKSSPEQVINLIKSENLPIPQDIVPSRDLSPDCKNVQSKEENAFAVSETPDAISVVNQINKTQNKGMAKEGKLLSLSNGRQRRKSNFKSNSQSSKQDAAILEQSCEANEKTRTSTGESLEQDVNSFSPKSAESSTLAIPCPDVPEIQQTGRSRKRRGCLVQKPVKALELISKNGKQTEDVQIELNRDKSMDFSTKSLLEDEDQLITTENLPEARDMVLSGDISIECNKMHIKEEIHFEVPMSVLEISDVSPATVNRKKTEKKHKAKKNSTMKRQNMNSTFRDTFHCLTPCGSEIVEKNTGRVNNNKEPTATEFFGALQGQARITVSRETRSKHKAKLFVAETNLQEERTTTNVHSNKLDSGTNILVSKSAKILVPLPPLPPSTKKCKTDYNRKAKKRCVWDYRKRRRSMKSKLEATPDGLLHCDSSILEKNSKKANNEEQHSVSEFCNAAQSEDKLLAVFDPAIDTTVRQGKRKAEVCCVDEKSVKLLKLNAQGDDLICNSKTVHGIELNGKSCDHTADLVKKSSPEQVINLIKSENLLKAQDIVSSRDLSPDCKNVQSEVEKAFAVSETSDAISVVNQINKTQNKGMAKEGKLLSLSNGRQRRKSNFKSNSQSSKQDAAILEQSCEANEKTRTATGESLEQDVNSFSPKSTESFTLAFPCPDVPEIQQTGRNQKTEMALDLKQKDQKLRWAGPEISAIKLDAVIKGDLAMETVPDRLDKLIIMENPTSEEQLLSSADGCNSGNLSPRVVIERLDFALIGLHIKTADISSDSLSSCCDNHSERGFTAEDTLTVKTGPLIPSCSLKSKIISSFLDYTGDENYTGTSVQQSEGQLANDSPAKRKKSRKSSKPMKILKLDEVVYKHISNDPVGLNDSGEHNVVQSVVNDMEPQALMTGERVMVKSDVPVTNEVSVAADVPVRVPRKSSIPQKRLLPLSEDIRHAGLRILEDEHRVKTNRGRSVKRSCCASDVVLTPVLKVLPAAAPKKKNDLSLTERDTKTRKVSDKRKPGKQLSSNSVASKRKAQMPKLLPVKELKDPETRGRRMPILAPEGALPEIQKMLNSNRQDMLSPVSENKKTKRKKTSVPLSVSREILEVSPSPMDGMLLSNDEEMEEFIPLNKPVIEYFESYCQLCGSKFASRELRDDHFKEMHVVGEPKRCLVCGKHFNRKDQLDYHLMVHFNCRPFPCNLCPKHFVRKDHLIRHTYTHKGEF